MYELGKKPLLRLKFTKNGNMQVFLKSVLDSEIAFKYADMSTLFIHLNDNINTKRSERRVKPA